VVESIAVSALVRRRSKEIALPVDKALLVRSCALATVRSCTQK
jgi:hypothetical protein